jgi:hypothetical protein
MTITRPPLRVCDLLSSPTRTPIWPSVAAIARLKLIFEAVRRADNAHVVAILDNGSALSSQASGSTSSQHRSTDLSFAIWRQTVSALRP